MGRAQRPCCRPSGRNPPAIRLCPAQPPPSERGALSGAGTHVTPARAVAAISLTGTFLNSIGHKVLLDSIDRGKGRAATKARRPAYRAHVFRTVFTLEHRQHFTFTHATRIPSSPATMCCRDPSPAARQGPSCPRSVVVPAFEKFSQLRKATEQERAWRNGRTPGTI